MYTIVVSDRGQIRQLNEDFGEIIENNNNQYLAVIADGMGGHKAGDVASFMAASILKEAFEKETNIQTAQDATNWLQVYIQKANEEIFAHARKNASCEGMGTTIVAAIITENFATIGHVGDSRCYLKNDTGFVQITNDHSLVYELMRTGQISKEEAEIHPMKNVVLRSVGTDEKVNIDIKTITFEENDMLLLCSDGLSNKLNEQEINQIIEMNNSLEEKANQLVALANEYGGEDNITVAIVHYISAENKDGDVA